MISTLNRLGFLSAPAGGLALLLGERILANSPASPYLSGIGVILLVGTLGWEAWRLRSGPAGRAWTLGRLAPAIPHALFTLAAALYFVARGLKNAPVGAVDWASLAGWGWTLLLLAGAAMFLFAELARMAQRRAPRPDTRRIGYAAEAGISIALLLALLVTLNFIFYKLPWEWNLAYFKTTRPSEATREVLGGLTEAIEAAAFFSEESPISPLVKSYFRELTENGAGEKKFAIQFVDAELEPDVAEAFKTRGNGWVILRKGETRGTIFIGDTIKAARGPLRKLDENVFSKLVEVSRKRQVAYMTVGHGERNESPREARDQEKAFGRFQGFLLARNFEVRKLGLSEGLGSRIPGDAGVVIIAAPTEPFLPSELETLQRYLDGGGKLWVFLEPDTARRRRPAPNARQQGPAGKRGMGPPGTLTALLESYGIRYIPILQANDRMYGRRTYTKADHYLLVTVRYSNHPSVIMLRRAANQFPLLLLESGALEGAPTRKDLEVQTTITGMPGTWADRNRNFVFDGNSESRGEPAVAMAVAPKKGEKEEAKARGKEPPPTGPTILAFADADLAADLLLQNRANRVLVEASLNWLASPQTEAAKYPSNEEDVKIVHAKGDDWLWFYLPVIGVPALALAFGFWRVGKRRRPSGNFNE